jgi:LysR family nitrogen assimilation transcriptional regulator
MQDPPRVETNREAAPATMDRRQLRYFRQVAADGSFTVASARLHVAQPALSRQIRKLEDELGTALLLRGRDGVKLTPSGVRLLEYAQRILQEFDEAVAELTGGPAERRVLRFGAPPSLGDLIFARIAELYSGHRSVRVLPVDVWSRDVPERLRDGRLDLAIITHPQPDPGIALTPLMTEPVYLIGPRDAETVPIDGFAALARIPLICMSRDHGQRLWLEQLARAHGIALTIRIETESTGGMTTMVAQGLGFAVLPLGGVQREVANGHLSATLIPGLRITRHLALLASRRVNPELRELVALVRGETARLGRSGIESYLSGRPADRRPDKRPRAKAGA